MHDQRIAKEHWRTRGAGAGFVVAVQIAPLPQHLAVGGIYACCAVRTEVQKHATLFDGRRGRGVGVVARDPLRLGDIEEVQIMQHLAGVLIHTNGKKLFAVLGRRGEPNLFAPNDRR